MPAGRPKGSRNKPKQALIAALREKHPDYQPVMTMVEGALELLRLARRAKDDPELWKDCIAAHDRVAQYIVPRLKAQELSVEDQGVIVRIVSMKETDEWLERVAGGGPHDVSRNHCESGDRRLD